MTVAGLNGQWQGAIQQYRQALATFATLIVSAIALAGCSGVHLGGAKTAKALPSTKMTTTVSKPAPRPAATTTTSTLQKPTSTASHCPAATAPVAGGGCVFDNGTCPGPLVPNAAGGLVCPEAILTPQTSGPPPIDCAHDGTGNGTWAARTTVRLVASPPRTPRQPCPC